MAISEQVIASASYTKRITVVDPLVTTNTTPNVTYSIPLTTNQAAYVKVDFVANNSAYTSAIGGTIQAVFIRATGNVSRTALSDSQGLLSTLLSSFLVTQPKVNAVANTTTQSIDITVTGVAATNISWHLEITSYLSN